MAGYTNIGKEAAESFFAGNGSVGISAQPLEAVGMPVAKHVVVRADSGNGSTIKVGPIGRSDSGFILNACEQTPPIYVDSTDKIEVIGGDADQVYSWIAN